MSDRVHPAQTPIEAPSHTTPRIGRGAALGFGGGLVGGILLGLGEGAVVLASASGAPDFGVLSYASALYGLGFAFAGTGLGIAFAGIERVLARKAVPEPATFARVAALLAALGAFGIGAFRVRRDIFLEDLKWKSVDGLLLLGGCAVVATLLYVALSFGLRRLVARRSLAFLLRAWGAPALLATVVALATGVVLGGGAGTEPVAGTSGASATKPPPAAGNVLVLVIDTLRADHLPAHGYQAIATPNLDRFAADAVRFENAYANASWTRPSFASILTGRYPSSHRTATKPAALSDELVTLAEVFHGGGYTTLGVVTNYNVAPFFNFQQGFDHYLYLEPEFVLGANDTAAKLLFAQFLRQRIETMRARSGRVERGSAYQDAEHVNAALLRLLDEHGKAPWFLFAGYMDPHDPYYPHPYDGTAYSRAAKLHPAPEEADALRKLYDGEIVYWDEHFGRLVEALRERGAYDDTTIVVTSDHGEEFMEHGGYWHGTTLYDEQIAIPLFVKLPRNERGGTTVSHWVESVDLLPTLVTRAGLKSPVGVQGKDLWAPSERAFAEEDHEGNVLRALRMRRGGEALKLIEANDGNPRGLEPFELFRIEQDPEEQVNLARDEKQLLVLTATELEASARAAASGRVSAQTVNVAAGSTEAAKLRALGYAGGDDDKAPAPAAEP